MYDLFDLRTSRSNEEYIALRDDPRNARLRRYCEDAWRKYERFADPQFPTEFALQPRKRFWELYLGAYFLENNFNLQSHKSEGPDFHIVHNNRNIWIEATVPGEGTGGDAVPSPYISDPNRFGKIPEDKIILRYANSISEKLKRYNVYIGKGIIASKDVFVVAINGMDIDFEKLNASPIRAIEKALCGIGQHILEFDISTMEIIEQKLSYRDKIKKSSGAPISTAPFLDPRYSGISGVLFSDTSPWYIPERPGNEFVFIHNYLASENGLEKNWVKHGRYCWLENNQYRVEPAG